MANIQVDRAIGALTVLVAEAREELLRNRHRVARLNAITSQLALAIAQPDGMHGCEGRLDTPTWLGRLVVVWRAKYASQVIAMRDVLLLMEDATVCGFGAEWPKSPQARATIVGRQIARRHGESILLPPAIGGSVTLRARRMSEGRRYWLVPVQDVPAVPSPEPGAPDLLDNDGGLPW